MQKISWAEAAPAPLVLLSGPEDALADRALAQIRGALAGSALEVHDVDASAYAPGTLLTLASPSLFGDPRLLRVANVEAANDAFLTDAVAYLSQADADTVVVFRHRKGQRGKGLLDTLRKHPHAVEIVCAAISERDRPAFIQADFRRRGVQITRGAVHMLSSAYAEDLSELTSVIDQLVRDCGAEVSERDVERLTEGRVETTAFKVADAACAGRGAEAIVLLRHALHTGVKPHQMLGALNMKVRAMARVSGTSGSIPGMQAWQIDRARRDARAWEPEALAALIDTAAETEWLLKGGSHEPEYALERYVLTISRRGRN